MPSSNKKPPYDASTWSTYFHIAVPEPLGMNAADRAKLIKGIQDVYCNIRAGRDPLHPTGCGDHDHDEHAGAKVLGHPWVQLPP